MTHHLWSHLPCFGFVPAVQLARAHHPENVRIAIAMRSKSEVGFIKLSHIKGTHIIAGINVAAAGVVPYVNVRGRGILFLLQDHANGTRAGLLSDFGGRREPSDVDPFVTAAREFNEETNGLFGDTHCVAHRLRRGATIRILNRTGRYVTFFLKVDHYYNPAAISEVDDTSTDGPTARNCRWLRADQVIRRIDDGSVLPRLITSHRNEAGLTSLHKAVLKTLHCENAHHDAYERWQSTVLSDLLEAADTDRRTAHRTRPFSSPHTGKVTPSKVANTADSRVAAIRQGSRAKCNSSSLEWDQSFDQSFPEEQRSSAALRSSTSDTRRTSRPRRTCSRRSKAADTPHTVVARERQTLASRQRSAARERPATDATDATDANAAVKT